MMQPRPHDAPTRDEIAHAAILIHVIIHLHGYSRGTTRAFDPATMKTQAVVNATRPDGLESWTVQADTEYVALVELARQLGIDLEVA